MMGQGGEKLSKKTKHTSDFCKRERTQQNQSLDALSQPQIRGKVNDPHQVLHNTEGERRKPKQENQINSPRPQLQTSGGQLRLSQARVPSRRRVTTGLQTPAKRRTNMVRQRRTSMVKDGRNIRANHLECAARMLAEKGKCNSVSAEEHYKRARWEHKPLNSKKKKRGKKKVGELELNSHRELLLLRLHRIHFPTHSH